MVPRLHKKGKSFKGAAAYILHDKKSVTSDRVEWTETRNLATDDPDKAWRVMAATAMSADQLKSEAGVKSTGRKTKDHVLHVTLSWHPEQGEEISKEEMMKAVNQALHALDAADRQALIAAHNDTDQPHVHVLINRVSSEDGRILSSSNEKRKIQSWASEYEREHGQVYCHNREANAEDRERKRPSPRAKHKSHHLHTVEEANNTKPGFDKAKAEQKAKDAALAAEGKAREERRRQAWQAFSDRQDAAIKRLKAEKEKGQEQAKADAAAAYQPQWDAIREQQREAQAIWDANEETLQGRIKNAARVTDWKGMVGHGAREKLGEGFNVFSSSAARRDAFIRAQEAERDALHRKELADAARRKADAARAADLARAEQMAILEAERSSLFFTEDMEDAAARMEWRNRNDERAAAYANLREEERSQPQQSPDTTQAPQPTDDGLTDEERAWMREYLPDPSNDNTQEQDPER